MRFFILPLFFTLSLLSPAQNSIPVIGTQTDSYLQTKSGIVIDGNEAFVLNSKSLQIFSTENSKLTLLSETNLNGKPIFLLKVDSLLLVTLENNQMFVITTTNTLEPKIVDTIFMAGTYTSFYDGKKIVIQQLNQDWSWQTHFFNPTTNLLVEKGKVPLTWWPLRYFGKNHYGVKTIDSLFIYNTIPTHQSLTPFAKLEWKNSSFPFTVKFLSDSVLVTADGTTGITLLKRAENGNTFTVVQKIDLQTQSCFVSENRLIIHDHSSIKLLKVAESGISEPKDSITYQGIQCFAVDKNNLVFTSTGGRAFYYIIENDAFVKKSIFDRLGTLQHSWIADKRLFMFSGLGKLFSLELGSNITGSIVPQDSFAIKPLFVEQTGNIVSVFGFNSQQNFATVIYEKLDTTFCRRAEIENTSLPVLFDSLLGFYSLANDTIKIWDIKETPVKLKKQIVLDRPIRLLKSHKRLHIVFNEHNISFYENLMSEKTVPLDDVRFKLEDEPSVLFINSHMIVSGKASNSATHIYDLSDTKNVRLKQYKFDSGFMNYDPETNILYLVNSNYIKAYQVNSTGDSFLEDVATIHEYNDLTGAQLVTESGGKKKIYIFNKTEVRFFDLERQQMNISQ